MKEEDKSSITRGFKDNKEEEFFKNMKLMLDEFEQDDDQQMEHYRKYEPEGLVKTKGLNMRNF